MKATGRQLMKTLREALRIGLLLVGCAIGLQVSYLLAQFGKIGQAAEGEIRATSIQVQNSLLYTQAVLSSARQTIEIVRKSAEQQMGYYEAMGRRSSLVLAELSLLIRHTDELTERITFSSERALESLAAMTNEAAAQTMDVGEQSSALLATATAAIAALQETAESPALPQSLEHLEAASKNVEAATQAAEEAMGHIRDMLSPTKKSFWRRFLELMIPRPTLSMK
ncbi:MAG: hypothetical protein HY313_00975 [Acidobacteria bacterium]|nr:hypothetical protein [Acidobacteriota bacterium]